MLTTKMYLSYIKYTKRAITNMRDIIQRESFRCSSSSLLNNKAYTSRNSNFAFDVHSTSQRLVK